MINIKSLLLVDDDSITNYLNERLISRTGVIQNVFITKNGKEALDFILHKGDYEENGTRYPKPELILLDLNMPVMDGFEFLDEFNKLNSVDKNNTIIVVLTTSQNEKDLERLKQYNVSDTLSKPLTEENLTAIVKKHFLTQNS